MERRGYGAEYIERYKMMTRFISSYSSIDQYQLLRVSCSSTTIISYPLELLLLMEVNKLF